MAHECQKIGNDVWCHLPDEIWDILQGMPRLGLQIFPDNAQSISTSFTRDGKLPGIEDLHFHDLRHGVSRLFEMGWEVFQGIATGTQCSGTRT